ncbi:MAG TPA: hypothetical protein VNI35_08050 [Nitrospira sp.]|nr:hypothetical protein [Nitrospira sp.]
MNRQHTFGSHIRNRSGLTLVEVMAAAFVLILVLLSSITALQFGFKLVDNARMAVLADQAMQSQMENLRLLNWSYIGGTPDANPWYFQSKSFTTNLSSATQPINFLPQLNTILGNATASQLQRIKTFTLSVTPTTDPTTGATRSEVMRLKIVIEWDGLGGHRFQREFQTMYAKAGISDYYYSYDGGN